LPADQECHELEYKRRRKGLRDLAKSGVVDESRQTSQMTEIVGRGVVGSALNVSVEKHRQPSKSSVSGTADLTSTSSHSAGIAYQNLIDERRSVGMTSSGRHDTRPTALKDVSHGKNSSLDDLLQRIGSNMGGSDLSSILQAITSVVGGDPKVS